MPRKDHKLRGNDSKLGVDARKKPNTAVSTRKDRIEDEKMSVDEESDHEDTGSSGNSGEDFMDEEDGADKSQDPAAFHEREKEVKAEGMRELPSAQELRAIFEASELYQSNAFKLQIDELLLSVSPKTSTSAKATLDAFLMELHGHLMGVSKTKNKKTSPLRFAGEPQSPTEVAAKLLSHEIAVPFPSPAPTTDAKWTFKYAHPESLAVIGSWPVSLSVKNQDKIDFGIDLAVAMPAEIFQEKDYVNDRYFHKRALYLACLACSVGPAFNVEVAYSSPLDDVRTTCLLLRPNSGSQHDWSKLRAVIRIIPVQPAESPIPSSRISPGSSNLRLASSDASSSSLPTGVTPHYNSLLALSRNTKETLLALHRFSTNVPQFTNAVKLLRVWANQRGFGKGSRSGCIRGWEAMGHFWSSLLGFLVEGPEPIQEQPKMNRRTKKMPTLGKGLSSYQLFRGCLDFLANRDFVNEPVFMKTNEGGHRFPPELWTALGRPLFVESTSTTNLLEGITVGSLALLRAEAAQTIKVLSSAAGDNFSSTFLRDLREPSSRFDVILRIGLEGVQARAEDGLAILDHGSYLGFVYHEVDRILRAGLGNRIKAMAALQAQSTSRPISQSQPVPITSFDLGLMLNAEHAFRLIDRGPAVDAPQSLIDAFRDFWGEKAELRRFADASIVECVVWEAEADRTNIPVAIVKHLVKRHFNLKKIREIQSAYNRLVHQPESSLKVLGSASAHLGYKAAMQAFDESVRIIKGIDLPLSLVACLPCAEALRYTSVFTPSPFLLSRRSRVPDSASFIQVYDAVLQFEKSARWPDDLGAIQKLKLAWFEMMATEVIKKAEGAHAAVAMDALASPVEDGASLEIVLPTGYAFRLRIYHDREKLLLEKAIGDKTLAAYQRADAERALAIHQVRFLDAPRYHAAILNVHRRHAGYSPTVRLVKRWLAAHLLSNHLSPELVELMCAHVFLRPDPQLVPSIGSAGFARVVTFLDQWDWRREPLGIPLFGVAGEDREKDLQLTVDERTSASKAFETRRRDDPGMKNGAWHIVTERDIAGVWWCLGGRGPSPMIADRIKALANASVRLIEGGLGTSLDAKSLFQHPLDDYDFVIHLDPRVLPRYTQNTFADEKIWLEAVTQPVNMQTQEAPDLLLDFDPARQYVEDLERIYSDSIAFFYDYFGGKTIGCSWNPLLRQPAAFRPLLGYSSRPDGGKKKGYVVLDEDAILGEIGRMGTGLVKEIVKQTSLR